MAYTVNPNVDNAITKPNEKVLFMQLAMMGYYLKIVSTNAYIYRFKDDVCEQEFSNLFNMNVVYKWIANKVVERELDYISNKE